MPSLPSSSLYTIISLFVLATATPTGIERLNINEARGTRPSQEDGPPISNAGFPAISWLPAQIGGIVAAYVVSVLFIGVALLFVGRRLRRRAQASPRTLAMEMMQPAQKSQAFDPSPITPGTGLGPDGTLDAKKGWPSPMRSRSQRGSDGWGSISKGHKKNQASVQSSVVTFDESVIESDMERNQREMERLYAAVMDHEQKRTESQVDFGLVQQQPQSPHGPPELQHLRITQAPPTSPPRSGTASPGRTLTKSPRSMNRPTPLSLHSHNSSRSSLGSGSLSQKRGFRGLPISPPMGSPGLVPDQTYDESEPLSPRVYTNPGPPPPTPPQMKTKNDRSDRLSPMSARFPETRFAESSRTPRTSVPASPGVHTIPEQYQVHVPQPAGSSTAAVGPAPDRSLASSQNSTRTKRTPTPLALRTQALSNAQQQHPNPLRTAPLPLRNPQAYPTNYNAAEPAIKATVLERPSKSGGMFSARTPRTGVPMTPYSPYMPHTPLTPITPSRLVTRQERKKREKEQGRRVLTEEDAVIEEADAWGM